MEPLHKIEEEHRRAKLVVFDLDGTLTPSKSDMDGEIGELVIKLLNKKRVAVIGGGKYEQFQKQFLSVLHGHRVHGDHVVDKLLRNLFLFPTSGSVFYRYDDGAWQEIYAEKLSPEEKKRTFEAFDAAFKELNYTHPGKIYGELIEDRDTQITFSALGQEAPPALKERWKKEHTEDKLKIVELMQKYLPDLEVRAGGYTSVDVTHKGVDKEYGIRQIKKHLGVDFNEMLFVGDALFPGGNDSAALRTGVPCFAVKGPEETEELIRALL